MNGAPSEAGEQLSPIASNVDEFLGLSNAEIIAKLKAFYDENWYKKDHYPMIHYDVAMVGPRLATPTQYNQMVKEKLSSTIPCLLDKTTSDEQGPLLLLLFKAELYDLAEKLVNHGIIDINLALKQCDEYTAYGQNGPYIEHITDDLLQKGAILPDGALITQFADEILRNVSYLNHVFQDVCDAIEALDFFLPLFADNPIHQQMFEKELISKMHVGTYDLDVYDALIDDNFVSKHFSSFFTYIKENNKDAKTIDRAVLLEGLVAFPDYIDRLFGDTKELDRYTNKDLAWDNVLRLDFVRFSKAMHIAVHHQKASAMLSKHLSELKSFSLIERGNTFDRWSIATQELLLCLPAIKADRKKVPHVIEVDKREKLDQLNFNDILHYLKDGHVEYPVKDSHHFFNDMKNAWQFTRLQGRTIILQNVQGDLLAIKVQKAHEAIEQLNHEMQTMQDLCDSRSFNSYVPTPISVHYFVGILEWLDNKVALDALKPFVEQVGAGVAHGIFVYQVHAEHAHYFTYLDDPLLTNKAFQKANRTVVGDLCQALAKGIVYPQLVNLFHNNLEVSQARKSQGRYLVLASVLSSILKYSTTKPKYGSVEKWKLTTEYPNVRGTGLAGWGNYAPLNEWLKNSKRIKNDYPTSFNRQSNKTGNFLIANILAEYQYVLFLIAGKRAIELNLEATHAGKSKEDIFTIWHTIANQVVDNCAQMVSCFSNLTEAQARKFLLTTINVNRLARQMQFWMTDDYKSHVSQNTIPQGIYEDSAKITVSYNELEAGTFHPQVGFSVDGVNQDLGPKDGGDPIKEANKLFHWMVNTIAIMYNQHRQTYEDVAKIVLEIDPEKRQLLYESSFSHLPKKQYHGLMFALTKKRLQTEPLPAAEQKELILKAAQHKKEYQISILQRIWRNRSKPEQSQAASSSGNVNLERANIEIKLGN